jgi:hypothetical protein
MKNKITITLIVYALLSIILFPLYRYYAITDFVPYADIALKYMNGNFADAVNGIWGPLISWLMIPFLWLNIDSLVAFKILNLIIGAFTIVGFYKLSKHFKLSNKIEWLVLLLLIPSVLTFAFVHTTPDLLVAGILLFYLNIIFKKDFGLTRKSAVYTGLLGGIGYLAKHYMFPFIIIHLPLSFIFRFFSTNNKPERKKLIKNFAVSLLVFLSISGAWITAQSIKYDHLTIGTSTAYNRAWMAPNSLGHAPEYLGLLEPANPTANSMWEDLTPYTNQMPGSGWSPFDGWKEFSFQAKLIISNLKTSFVILNKFALVLGPLILLWIAIYVFKKIKKRKILLDPIFLSLTAMFIYGSGYLLIRSSDRYIWLIYFFLLIIGGHILDIITRRLQNNPYKKTIFVIIILFFSFSFLFTPARRFHINVNEGKDPHDISTVLNKNNVKGNIASDSKWSDTSMVSYYLQTKYFGMPRKNQTNQELTQELKTHNIDYYLNWSKEEFIFENKTLNPLLNLPDLHIYKLK